jgi:3-oxoacyl-[acyl-carrier protein] reductase
MSETVLITGASRGIGSAAARLFARSGYNVIVNFNRSESAAKSLEKELCCEGFSVMAFRADVRVRKQVEKMVDAGIKRFGNIDVLVNNAGTAQQKLFTEITESEFDDMLNVHVKGAFNCIQSVLPEMVRRKQGNIVNVSSVWGLVGGSCEVHYSAAKAALIGMTKALAKELGPSNIRVNCVAPGVIRTDMTADLDDPAMEELKSETPLMRLGSPEEAAEAILFLASQKAGFITGQVLSVGGGFMT